MCNQAHERKHNAVIDVSKLESPVLFSEWKILSLYSGFMGQKSCVFWSHPNNLFLLILLSLHPKHSVDGLGGKKMVVMNCPFLICFPSIFGTNLCYIFMLLEIAIYSPDLFLSIETLGILLFLHGWLAGETHLFPNLVSRISVYKF